MKMICRYENECYNCPKMGSCNGVKYDDLLKDFFALYNTVSKKDANKTFYIWHPHPETLHKVEEITRRYKIIDEDIERLEKTMLELQAYKIALTDRINYLLTVPTKEKIKLQRYKKYQGNVYYYIIFYTVNLDDGTETETDRITFNGTDRKKALEAFEKLKKERRNTDFVKDIAKPPYER